MGYRFLFFVLIKIYGEIKSGEYVKLICEGNDL